MGCGSTTSSGGGSTTSSVGCSTASSGCPSTASSDGCSTTASGCSTTTSVVVAPPRKKGPPSASAMQASAIKVPNTEIPVENIFTFAAPRASASAMTTQTGDHSQWSGLPESQAAPAIAMNPMMDSTRYGPCSYSDACFHPARMKRAPTTARGIQSHQVQPVAIPEKLGNDSSGTPMPPTRNSGPTTEKAAHRTATPRLRLPRPVSPCCRAVKPAAMIARATSRYIGVHSQRPAMPER